jgi:hypothetical protein
MIELAHDEGSRTSSVIPSVARDRHLPYYNVTSIPNEVRDLKNFLHSLLREEKGWG